MYLHLPFEVKNGYNCTSAPPPPQSSMPYDLHRYRQTDSSVLHVAQQCLCRYFPRRLFFLTSFDSASCLTAFGLSSYPYFVWFVRLSSFLVGPILIPFVRWLSFPVSLVAFAELRKATISFVMPVCLSVCPSVFQHGTTGLLQDGLSWNLYFSNICEKYKFY
jgi:hypothetical protein